MNFKNIKGIDQTKKWLYSVCSYKQGRRHSGNWGGSSPSFRVRNGLLKNRDESIYDKRKVENNAIDYRLQSIVPGLGLEIDC